MENIKKSVPEMMMTFNHILKDYLEDVIITVSGHKLNSKNDKNREIIQFTLTKKEDSIDDIKVEEK